MNRTSWWILLGGALIIVICCCVAASVGLGAGLWLRTTLDVESSGSGVVQEPTPVLAPVQRASTSPERATAELVANSTLPMRDLVALAQRLQGTSPSATAVPPAMPPDYEVGDRQTFWVHDVEAISFFTSTASLQYETPHAYWWVEEGYEIPADDLEWSAERFENQTYPTNRRYFGSEWNPGIDGDPHVYIFLGDVPGVGGYFSSPDEYPVSVRPNSNEHEMFYINLDNAMPGNDYFDGILAHEFQHMIHWAADRNEDAWVNEGLSELAAHVNGYDVGGSDYLFSTSPDTQLTAWSELEESGPHYGASYVFLAYFLEQYGEDAVRGLVAEPDNGIDGINAVLAQMDPDQRQFDDLFADWVVANYLDKPRLAAGHYGYADLQIEQPQHAAYHTSYPVQQRAGVHQYAADYIVLEAQGDLTAEFTGSLTIPLVGNDTHSGEYQWWSNRGDDGDATLTRAFDLSGLESATLQTWMWYDLEKDWDYAYVEVSADGGNTWTLLANDTTTTTNPSGNSYGPALTGVSGGGEHPRWSLERFDLSPFAGEQILIRFEVITDEALNLAGLCLDDISIPELGYQDNVEAGTGEWEAEGWLRVTSRIPQQFAVQVISLGSEPQVQRMALDEQMRGTTTIRRQGQDSEKVLLVVSALAPVTTEKAVYSYQVTQE